MPWVIFIISSLIVVVAANKLAEYSDIIAVRTRLGGVLIGTIFLAGATSLPEFIASISSFRLGQPDLAAGNFLGSNMVNMFLLAMVDLFFFQTPLLRGVAISHTLTAALAVALTIVATIFILIDMNPTIGWVGVDSLLLIALYFGGLWLIQRENKAASAATEGEVVAGPEFPSLAKGVIGFVIAAGFLVLVVPYLVGASNDIATITGLGTTFVGTALLSLVTSLPELIAVWAAVRMGAVDLAVGNLFGSNVFNMLAMGISDFLYRPGSLLNAVNNNFVLVGLFGSLLMMMALIANLARVERKFLFIELDAVAIIVVYLLGTYLLFLQAAG